MKINQQGRAGLQLGIAMALVSFESFAQTSGVTTQGSTGGMVVPSAQVLSQGSVALSYGNYQEPQLGTFATQQNLSLGIGVLPGVELFGRLTNYTTPVPGSMVDAGLRDLSANLKLQLPMFWKNGPQMALGMTDVSGGALNFKSNYFVATQDWGGLTASLGYAAAKAETRKTFDGVFGGVYWQMGNSGVSLMAEHDSQQKHVGVRWRSDPIASLGRSQWVGTLQHVLDPQVPVGQAPGNATKIGVTLVVPFGENRARIAKYQPAVNLELPAVEEVTNDTDTAKVERLQQLQKTLSAVGLERVRVGTRSSALGTVLVVEYENHRYAHNEVDALGLVFGLAAESAPAGIQRVQAVTLKNGLPVYETSVGVADFRLFLRNGAVGQARSSLIWSLGASGVASQVDWLDGGGASSHFSNVRIEVKPDFNYVVGTEFGVLDYSLAANLQATVPLWRGGKLYTGYTLPMAHTANVDEGYAYSLIRHRAGMKTMAVGQTVWLGKQFLAQVDVGRFHYDVTGVQAEGAFISPASGDLLRLRGAAYNQAPGGIAGNARNASASYRRVTGPESWVEAGVQGYSDGSYGPSIEWVRWFGDLRLQMSYRRGGDAKFAGLQLSIPLSPRQGMQPGAVVLKGTSQYNQGIRTRITSADQPANLVQPGAVQDLRLEGSLDVDVLNGGRISQAYMQSQLDRMREAFYLYARQSVR